MRGYLDRIEDNDNAVILIEAKNTEIILPLGELPTGSTEKTWLHLEQENDTFKVISIDYETTRQKAQQATDIMEKLRKRKKPGRFKQ